MESASRPVERADAAATRPRSRTAAENAARAIALAAFGALAVAVAIRQLLDLSIAFVWTTSLLLAIGGSIVLALARRDRVHDSFGIANIVTLSRGALAIVLIALLGERLGAAGAWVAVALALVCLVLDNLDGRLARGRGEVSAFGARFDMEADALVILALAALAWQLDKAGVWIIAAGALRYAFAAGALAVTWLSRPLPPSRRRQAICVVQIVSLILCLVPPVTPPASSAVALAGLLLLVWSFAVDVAWLARRTAD
jgi:phosphatidylglycerophosphate synthase